MHPLAILTTLLLAAPTEAIDFDTEVMPILTRAGCNTGACHGAAIGQGGFRLSLLGERPADDYVSIVHELEGRRVNLAHAEKSLLLAKAGELLEHGGGLRLPEDSAGHQVVQDWIAAGAPRKQLRQLARLTVEPRQKLLSKLHEPVQIRVLAEFDDGSRRDVTAWSVIAPNDPAAAEVDAAGVATLKRAGQTALIVRFLDRVAAVQLAVPLSDRPLDLSKQPRRNFIDEELLATLAELRIPVASQCDDATFLRRARLDLTGTLPSPNEVREFLANPATDKRERLIDRLLQSPEYADLWAHKWSDLLRINSNRMDKQGVQAFHGWLRDQIATSKPLDAMVRQMLTALGDAHTVGPANFARATTGPREQAEHVSQVFLGARLGCANCHNHPLDRWTQDDYHGLAAIFARLERSPMVKLSSRGDVTHPRSGVPALPRLPGARFLPAESDGREPLAVWLTSPENPAFAHVCVNRIWAEMFGRGLVEPVDDMRETNPATYPVLLARLADDFVKHGFDQRHTLRLLATSAAYARAGEVTGVGGQESGVGGQESGVGGQESGVSPSENNASRFRDDRFYSTFPAKPLPPEVLLDAICNVTGVAERFGDLPETTAIALADSKVSSQALDILGRCSRDAPCLPASATAGLPTKLHLINGPLINRKIASAEGRLHKLLATSGSDAEMLEELYLRAIGRLPVSAEIGHWSNVLKLPEGELARKQAWEDILWGLLNCREFMMNR